MHKTRKKSIDYHAMKIGPTNGFIKRQQRPRELARYSSNLIMNRGLWSLFFISSILTFILLHFFAQFYQINCAFSGTDKYVTKRPYVHFNDNLDEKALILKNFSCWYF